jgi:hypothetical protein
MKDKIVQWLFYLWYFICSIGIFFFFLVPEPYGPWVYPISIILLVIGVAAEMEYFRPVWPVEGTREYEQIVNRFENAVWEGVERYNEKQRVKINERLAQKKNQGARDE